MGGGGGGGNMIEDWAAIWSHLTCGPLSYSEVLGELSYNYTMRFIGYDSIQSRWFISYRFQIRTIT